MHCASKAMNLFSEKLNSQETPSWYTGRLWLMRLGYYKLHRPKTQAEDWIWIVDHSVQIGVEKCLMILGIRLKDLPQDRALTYQDVEPIDLVPVKESNGNIVYAQLEEAVKKTGVPREIISDHGSDLLSGINHFLEKHLLTCSIYDIKHKTASILKRELENDESWKSFIENCTQTKIQVQQTGLAFLAPPNQRSKSRYMNVDTLVEWGIKALNFIETEKENPNKNLNQEKIKVKLHWLVNFEKKINEWKEMLWVVELTESSIRKKGYTQNMGEILENDLNKFSLCDNANKVKEDLLNFIKQESKKAKADERLLGSSEIIESVFGKQKMLERDQSKNGFTGIILSVGAFLATTTEDIIMEAVTTVKTKTVCRWVKEKIGETVQSCRVNLLNIPNKTNKNGINMEPMAI